ncbi:hypothetical protein L3476_25215 [Paenibacillus thiaminolyticus]|uniref:hypothetical protein n=1 Tax=Paenibacillus thiaminolyticus TaxID=49283 RepID=UPI00234FD482|nr:hypothetical protein [Paenibacillus thiaminolyticus]WCR26488.1 hypothetical protein L3476_25215 [Paenibacillus thiaminolyticus]
MAGVTAGVAVGLTAALKAEDGGGNPAFLQQFTVYQPLSDEIAAKAHHFPRFLLSIRGDGLHSCCFAGISVTEQTSQGKAVILQHFWQVEL